MSGNGLQSKWSVLTINRHINDMTEAFQVTGGGHRGIGHSGVGPSALGHRVSGAGVQVRVRASGDAFPNRQPLAANR